MCFIPGHSRYYYMVNPVSPGLWQNSILHRLAATD
jgi:hypothetical protein